MTVSIEVDVESIEIDGKHWISTRANGRETSQQGPFPDAAAARAAADRHMRRWRKTAGGNGTAVREKRCGNSEPVEVDTKVSKTDGGASLPTVLDTTSFIGNEAFVLDFCRFSEGSLDEKFLRRKYRFDQATWERLGDDEALIERVEGWMGARARGVFCFGARPS
jgi:hypothetical protein